MKKHAFVPDVTGFPGCAEHVMNGKRIATCDRPMIDPVHIWADHSRYRPQPEPEPLALEPAPEETP
jgi:hypothetical protein